jgi:hypothetical protein
VKRKLETFKEFIFVMQKELFTRYAASRRNCSNLTDLLSRKSLNGGSSIRRFTADVNWA